jgi:hypothetical protein
MLEIMFILLLSLLLPQQLPLIVSAAESPLGSDYETPTLRPIHIDDYESATGFSKRSGPTELDQMKPSHEAHLSYGSPGGEYQ